MTAHMTVLQWLLLVPVSIIGFLGGLALFFVVIALLQRDVVRLKYGLATVAVCSLLVVGISTVFF